MARGVRAQGAGGDALLVFGLRTFPGRADFGQPDAALPPVRVLLQAKDQVHQRGRPHRVQFGGNRVGDARGVFAIEQRGLIGAAEGPRNRLRPAIGGQRAAGAAGALRAFAQHRLTIAFQPRQRRGVQLVIAVDAGDFLDQIGVLRQVAAPGRRLDDRLFAHAVNRAAEIGQDLHFALFAQRQTGKAARLRQIEADRFRRSGNLARDFDLGGFAAAQLHDHFSGQFQPGLHEMRVDAAREAVLRIRHDAQLAAYLRNGDGVPQRGFDQNVRGLVRATGFLAAHDAGQRFHARIVGNHPDFLVQRVFPLVQRLEGLSLQRAADHQIAFHLGRIENMQRASAVIGDEIGDIDQRINRTQANRLQARLQPVRRRTVLHAAHQPKAESRAEISVADRDLDRAREGAADRARRAVLQLAQPGGGQIAGDALYPQPVRAVGRHFKIDHRVGHAQRLCGGRANGPFVLQVRNAVMVFTRFQLLGGAEHAVAFDPADLARLLVQREIQARNIRPQRRIDADHAGAGVRRAADDLLHPVHGLDRADFQLVGVRMLFGGDHLGRGEGRKARGGILDALDLQAGHRHRLDDFVERGLGFQVLFQPGQGEFHQLNPVARFGWISAGKL